MSVSMNISDGSFTTEGYSYEYFTDTSPIEESSLLNLHGLIWPAIFTLTVSVANALSLTAFRVERRLYTYNNIFIINLTLADFLTGLTLITTTAHTYLGYFPLSQLFCKIQDGIRNALFTVSNIAVVVICVDRHRAIYAPIKHFMSRSKRKAIMISVIPWLISFSFWIPFATIWDIIVGTDTGNHCVLWYIRNPNAFMIATLITFFIPFILIAYLNFAILFRIFKTVGGKNVSRKFKMQKCDFPRPDTGLSSLADGPSSGVNTDAFNDDTGSPRIPSVEVNDVPDKYRHQGMKEKEESRETRRQVTGPALRKEIRTQDSGPALRKETRTQESGSEMRKATRTLLFIVIIFVITWLPHSLISLLYALHPPLVVPGLPRPYRLFFRWLSYSNSLFNPIAYVVSQPLFRSTVVRFLTCRYWIGRRQ